MATLPELVVNLHNTETSASQFRVGADVDQQAVGLSSAPSTPDCTHPAR